uniref:P2Y purinoceptor 13 n=1 Tax=Jaculus jaculus TaxID=51337 RepID=UPI00064D2C74|nr:P2Y purinoceptor 13 [Jaculus jaculus]
MLEETLNATAMQAFNKSELCPRDTRVTRLVFPVLYAVVFLTGILLNSLALWVFVHIPSNSTFIVYLKNTLVADLVMTLMLPFKILSDSQPWLWRLRAFVCRFSSVIFYGAMYVSIVLLALIAFDRFLKIARPFGKLFAKKTVFAKIASMLVWVLFFLISVPNMILSNKEATPSSVKCTSLKVPLGLKWHRLVNYICQGVFWTIFVLMLLCYVVIAKKVYDSSRKFQSKEGKGRAVEGKVFVVMAIFFLCFAPFHFVRVPYTQSQTSNHTDCRLENQLFVAKESTLFLAATNICMDPLIYMLLCKKFTEKLPFLKGKRMSSSGQENHSSQTDNVILA